MSISVIAVGGVDGPVGVMLGIAVVLLEEIYSLFPSFPVIVGGPGEVLVGGVYGNAKEVVPLHQGSREGMDGDGLEIGWRGDELENVIDVVLFDVGGIHCRRGIDRVVFHRSRRDVYKERDKLEPRSCRRKYGPLGVRGRTMGPVFSGACWDTRDIATTPSNETFTIKTVTRLNSGKAVCFGTPSSCIFGPGMLSLIVSARSRADPTRLT